MKKTAKEESEIARPTKGETYGKVYRWAVDVSVPERWDEKLDKKYLADVLGLRNGEDICQHICSALEDFQGALTFAFWFLTGQSSDPSDGIFRHLPLRTKVEMLKRLFRQRSLGADYLERFDNDLRRFLDVETFALPVLERYLIDPQSVWLRELVDASDCVTGAWFEFTESMACELEGCPRYFGVDRVDPPSFLMEGCLQKNAYSAACRGTSLP